MRTFLISLGLFLIALSSHAIEFTIPHKNGLEGGRLYIDNSNRFDVGASLYGNQDGMLSVHVSSSTNCSEPGEHFIVYIRRANGQVEPLNPNTTAIGSSRGVVAGFANVQGIGDLLITSLSGKAITLQVNGKVKACWIHP